MSDLFPNPTAALVTLVFVVVVAVLLGWTLRLLTARMRTLRSQLLLISLAGLIVGAGVAWQAATQMLFDGQALGPVLVVLVITAVVATVIVTIASGSFTTATARLTSTVRAVEAGDRDVRTNLDRRDEIGRVANAVDDLSRRLADVEAERARLDAEHAVLLTSISHDLRSPLAALRAALEALIDGVAPDRERYLRSMQADAEALTHLVDDAFLVASISGGRLHLQQELLDVAECCDTAIEVLRPLADSSAVELTLEVVANVRVQANVQALGRVLRNLIDNAVRHSPRGGTVRVVVDEQPDARVQVLDDGPGFDPGFVETALQPWTRADSARNRVTGGSGLGLAIASGLIGAQGGTLTVAPGPGGKATFTLPRA